MQNSARDKAIYIVDDEPGATKRLRPFVNCASRLISASASVNVPLMSLLPALEDAAAAQQNFHLAIIQCAQFIANLDYGQSQRHYRHFVHAADYRVLVFALQQVWQ